MPNDEINPHHPVTQAAREQWHKLFAIFMQKQGLRHVVITDADIRAACPREGCNIAIEYKADGIHLRLFTDAEALRLARAQGGIVPPGGN